MNDDDSTLDAMLSFTDDKLGEVDALMANDLLLSYMMTAHDSTMASAIQKLDQEVRDEMERLATVEDRSNRLRDLRRLFELEEQILSNTGDLERAKSAYLQLKNDVDLSPSSAIPFHNLVSSPDTPEASSPAVYRARQIALLKMALQDHKKTDEEFSSLKRRFLRKHPKGKFTKDLTLPLFMNAEQINQQLNARVDLFERMRMMEDRVRDMGMFLEGDQLFARQCEEATDIIRDSVISRKRARKRAETMAGDVNAHGMKIDDLEHHLQAMRIFDGQVDQDAILPANRQNSSLDRSSNNSRSNVNSGYPNRSNSRSDDLDISGGRNALAERNTRALAQAAASNYENNYQAMQNPKDDDDFLLDSPSVSRAQSMRDEPLQSKPQQQQQRQSSFVGNSNSDDSMMESAASSSNMWRETQSPKKRGSSVRFANADGDASESRSNSQKAALAVVNNAVPDTLAVANSDDDVLSEWLNSLFLPQYIPIFRAHQVDPVSLVFLTETDLLDMGVSIPAHRQKMMRSIREASDVALRQTEIEAAADKQMAEQQQAEEEARKDEVNAARLAARDAANDVQVPPRNLSGEDARVQAEMDLHFREYFESNDIGAVLRGIGHPEYMEMMLENGIDVRTFMYLTDADLQTLGVAAIGPRRKMLVAIARLNDLYADYRIRILRGDPSGQDLDIDGRGTNQGRGPEKSKSCSIQ